MAGSTVSFSEVYPGFARAASSAPPVTQQASGGAPSSNMGSGTAPAIAWLGLVIALVALRVLYEMGAKVD